VVLLLQCRGTVKAGVHPIGCAKPRMTFEQVVEAQRGTVAPKQVEHFVIQPRRVTKLDGPPQFRRQKRGNRKEFVQASRVSLPPRWQLDDGRPECTA